MRPPACPAGQLIDRQGNPLDDAFADEVLVDERLELAGDDRPPRLEQAGHDHEAIAGPHEAAEADVFHAAEAHHAVHQPALHRVVARQLGGRLAHDHARHQRHARHVTAGPEFVGLEVLVADADAADVILEDDRRQLLHLETLRIVAADLLDGADHVIEVVFREVDDQRFLGHGWLPGISWSPEQ